MMVVPEFKTILEQAEAAFAAGDYVLAAARWLDAARIKPERGSDAGSLNFRINVARRLGDLDALKAEIARYGETRLKRAAGGLRVAVYTCITGSYDSLKLPAVIDPRLDYVLFTDRPRSGGGVWDVQPLNIAEACPSRASRYAKMHPHLLLPDHEVGVWIDANITLAGDIFPMIERFMAAPEAVGAVRHPHRSTIYEEVEACIRQKKDRTGIMREQVAAARRGGFVHDDLVEANVLMFKLRDARTRRFLAAWWAGLERYSKRDQLAFNLALRQAGLAWHRLVDRPASARNHPNFFYLPHDRDSGPAARLLEALAIPPTDPWARTGARAARLARTADVPVLEARRAGEAASLLASSTARIVIIKDPAFTLAARTRSELVTTLRSAPGAGIAVPAMNALPSFPGRDPVIAAGSRTCMAIRREVLEAAGFPDDGCFPGIPGWDVDLCFRAAEKGFGTRLSSAALAQLHGAPPAPRDALREARARLAARHGRQRLARAAASWSRVSEDPAGLPEALRPMPGSADD